MWKSLALQKKHDLPDEFHFKYAQVLDLAGQYQEAVDAVTHYLQTAGRGGAHYREALTLLHTASQSAEAANLAATVARNMAMAVVPAGSYLMGSPSSEEYRTDDEGPQHRVPIREPFAVGIWSTGTALRSGHGSTGVVKDGMAGEDSGAADRSRTTGAALEAHYQFIRWLVPALERFPRSQKFLLGDRIQGAALDVLDELIEATYTRQRSNHLARANLGLEKLRILVRLSCELHYLDQRRYEHAGRALDATTGRRIGAWRKAHRARETPGSV